MMRFRTPILGLALLAILGVSDCKPETFTARGYGYFVQEKPFYVSGRLYREQPTRLKDEALVNRLGEKLRTRVDCSVWTSGPIMIPRKSDQQRRLDMVCSFGIKGFPAEILVEVWEKEKAFDPHSSSVDFDTEAHSADLRIRGTVRIGLLNDKPSVKDGKMDFWNDQGTRLGTLTIEPASIDVHAIEERDEYPRGR